MVGIGPGGPKHRTLAAVEAIEQSDLIVGYTPYIESVQDMLADKETFVSGMRQEIPRARHALEQAANGRTVALISSGDAGIYGMAGLAMELAEADGLDVEIEVIPGVTASSAAGAALGAPLMLDYATISLSDLLVPWPSIRERLEAVAKADMVVALYNPRSRRRIRQLDETVEIFLGHRPGATPAAVVTSAGTQEQQAVVTDLDNLLQQEVNMKSLVIIGNSQTTVIKGRMVTARGYKL